MILQKHTYDFPSTPYVRPYALRFSYFHAALRPWRAQGEMPRSVQLKPRECLLSAPQWFRGGGMGLPVKKQPQHLVLPPVDGGTSKSNARISESISLADLCRCSEKGGMLDEKSGMLDEKSGMLAMKDKGKLPRNIKGRYSC